MALFMDLVALSNGLHGSVQMDSVALFSWIGWLRHHGILTALQPDERLTQMIHGLHERGFHKIAVMDDGSSDDRQKYFQEVEIMGVKVIHHSKKMGKGVALRLADEKIGESDFYITADCDGQYSPEDIVAKEL